MRISALTDDGNVEGRRISSKVFKRVLSWRDKPGFFPRFESGFRVAQLGPYILKTLGKCLEQKASSSDAYGPIFKPETQKSISLNTLKFFAPLF